MCIRDSTHTERERERERERKFTILLCHIFSCQIKMYSAYLRFVWPRICKLIRVYSSSGEEVVGWVVCGFNGGGVTLSNNHPVTYVVCGIVNGCTRNFFVL